MKKSDIAPVVESFNELELLPVLLSTLAELGYEAPTPIQQQSIPVMLAGHDLLAQAQTGTGKTAAFALPILSMIDLSITKPQALVIVPTRELAIQVAEAFQRYAKQLKGFHVLPIYGGQDYEIQLRGIKRGVHVIVGTPGRLMDHLRRKLLSIETLKAVVLDEADEMLNMGFIEDIEWILSQLPPEHQTALFSATLPAPIQKIASKYLKDPKKVLLKSESGSVDAIDQSFIRVNNSDKLDLLTRFLEVEDIQAALIFARTKNTVSELAEKLQARGFAVAALHGDIAQALRKKVIDRLKSGDLDIVIATDVAARGIDVNRMSHVINYDIPFDTESYIHRIGRTGRAGRKGKALLFVTPREQRLLRNIENAIHKPIKQIDPPSLADINKVRCKQLTEKIANALQVPKKMQPYQVMVENMMTETGHSLMELAAALVSLTQQVYGTPVEIVSEREPERRPYRSDRDRSDRPYRSRSGGSERPDRDRSDRDRSDRPNRSRSGGSDRSDRERSDRPYRARSEDRPSRPRSEGFSERSERPDRDRADRRGKPRSEGSADKSKSARRPDRERSDRGVAPSRGSREGRPVSGDRPDYAKKKKKYGSSKKASPRPESSRKKLSLKSLSS